MKDGSSIQQRYFITDHLGSTRVVLNNAGNVLERYDYYPYGEKIDVSVANTGNTDYLYTGKESQNALFGINWYDSAARFQTTDGIFTSLDPLAEKYYHISPYAYCAGNPVNQIDLNGQEIQVSEEYQEQFLDDLKKVFGEKVDMFSFNENGILQLDKTKKEFTKGLSKDQKKSFKGLNKAMSDSQVTSVVYEDKYEITVNNEKVSTDIIDEYGGGLYSKIDNVIVVAPNAKAVSVDLLLITPGNVKSTSQLVEQNTTSILFHEIGERNLGEATHRGAVIDYENNVRRIIGLPKRPYDMYHSYTIGTNTH